jgi:hypothetical protein
MNTLPVLSAVALACALTAAPAHAGRPLQTEDAGLLDRGNCELEGATARLKAFGATARETSLQIGCGIGVSTQMALALSGGKDDGLGSRGVELNGKTRLWTGEAAKDEEPAALVLAYALSSAKASADKWRHAATELNLAYSRPLPSALTLHANLGHARDEIGKMRATTWSMALEHAGFSGLAPMAELFGDDRAAPWWNLGLRYSAVPDTLFIDASYGRQIAGGRPTLVTVGFKFAF